MSFKKVIWIVSILLGIQLFVELTHAQEAAPPADAKAAPVLSDWVPVETKIQELSAKAKSKEALLQKLLEEKKSMRDGSPELRTKINEIVTEHKDLKKMIKDLQSQVNLLKYRYPERYSQTNRKYDRVSVPSLEDMEQSLGIDGKLSRNMHRFRSQYQVKPATDRSPASAEAEALTIKKKPKEPSIEEADSVILKQ